MQDKNNFEKILTSITGSSDTADNKMFALNNLVAGLNSFNHNKEIKLASEAGAVIAQQSDRPEMGAQFCLLRAKAEIAEVPVLIKEMKELTMAIEWFDFALESEKKRYKELNTKLQTTWANTQALIDMGYKLINKKPYVGAVAYCHRTAGEIYASYYLQLKLHYFISGRPWKAKIGNFVVVRWLGLDDLLIMNKKSRKHLHGVKNDCLKSLHSAVKLFKNEKATVYVVETYFDLVLEHHSFNDSVRSKFYLWYGWILMKWFHIKEPRLERTFTSLGELPLIGSRADKKATQ